MTPPTANMHLSPERKSVPATPTSDPSEISVKPVLGGLSGGRATPRSACEPCRNRKIKCTGERPICARCAKMGKSCEYQSAASSYTYISALEQKVKSLEAENDRLVSEFRSNVGPSSSSASERPSAAHAHQFTHPAKRSRLSYNDLDDEPHSPATAIASTSLALLGASASRESINNLPSNTQLLERLPTGFDLMGIISRQDATSIPSTPQTLVDRTILPSPHVVHELLDHFQTYTGGAYPIFHNPTLRRQVEGVCMEDKPVSKTDICIVMLVLAVSATSLPRTSPLYHDLKPRALDFWNYAQHHLPAALDSHGMTRLQILLIHLQYVLYNPNAGNIWDLSGAAVRAAVDLGLHHEHGLKDIRNHLDHDMRRRLFWVSYAVDRSMCTALGRPPAIADDWINADFPSIVDDSLITPSGILPGDPSPLKATAIHNFRIRILQSEVHHRLFRPSGPSHSPPPQEWYDSLVDRLRQWRNTLPSGTGFCSEEWLNLNFHITMVMLFRPSPANPTPGREALTKALTSSGAVMRTYKDMYRMGRINFNWLAMNQLFIAGVTYLNSLWQAHRSGWSIVPSYVDALLDVQVCTSVMEALAAITPGTSNIRNAFESVSERIIRHLTSGAQWSTNVMAPPSPSPSSTLAPEQSAAHLSSNGIHNAQNLLYLRSENQSQNQSLPSEGNGVDSWRLYEGSTLFEGLTPANPLDGFLLHPLGEMSADDWERAVGQALQPLQESS